MQVIDRENRVIFTNTGKLEVLENEAEDWKRKPNVKEVVIADLPKLDEIITHKGLIYRVKSIHSRRRFIIQLV